MFEEADAVGDARCFLTGTGRGSGFSEEGRAKSALGPFPRPGAARPGAWCGGCGLRTPASGPGWGTGPGSARRFRFDSLGLLYKMSRRGKGRAGGTLARERRPSASGGRGGRQGRAGTHLCVLRAPCVRRPRAGRGGMEMRSEGADGRARRSPPGPGTLGQRPKRAFPLRRLAWVYTFLAPGVCTLKHLFNIKEAACAAVVVRPERMPVSSKALNESPPRGPMIHAGFTRARTRRVPLTQG